MPMKFWQMLVVLVTLGGAMPTTAQDTPAVMDGFPPSTESQVTKKNHRDWPYSQWAFQNFGAPNNTVMVPRGGEIHHFPREESRLDQFTVCLLYTSPSPRDLYRSRMPSSA